MVPPLPSLAAIRVFEAVARRQSFTRAAEELGITQAAVSFQIKRLENQLATALFLRRGRTIVLTDTAQRLAPYTTEAFNLLRETFRQEAERQEEILSVNTTHAFAALWLAPRLGRFRRGHAGIAVRIETTTRVVNLEQEDVDVVVRAGSGNWPGLVTSKVLDISYALMLSPALAAQAGGIHSPADIARLPLLDSKHPWWATWLRTYNLPFEILERQSSPALGTQVATAHAAMDGLGAALLTPAYFQRELADGRLVQPLADTLDEDWAYWLAYPEGRRRLRKVKAFREWILAEAAEQP